MYKEIWVAGYPSLCGGADTELLANIELLCMKGVTVHLVPMFGSDDRMNEYTTNLGCVTHKYYPEIFKDKILISFCNGKFLETLPEIMEKGKPEQVIWFNCMTWTFAKEIEAHKNGWIDKFGFVSNYQREWLEPLLAKHGPVNVFEGYQAYFNPNSPMLDLPYHKRDVPNSFNMGRVSRSDPAKFSSDMWQIYNKVLSPKPKKVFVLGYNNSVQKKTGSPPDGLDFQWWTAGSIPVKEFFSKIHVLIHKTGGSRESYGRVIPEAYCSGIPVIVEDDYAFPDIVVDGVTGFRCKSSDEMSFRASQLAFDEDLRNEMSINAREYLMDNMASIDKCWKAWSNILIST